MCVQMSVSTNVFIYVNVCLFEYVSNGSKKGLKNIPQGHDKTWKERKSHFEKFF